MKNSNKNKTKGTFHEIKGKIKEAAGVLNDNPELKAEGAGEKVAGKTQRKIGEIETVFYD